MTQSHAYKVNHLSPENYKISSPSKPSLLHTGYDDIKSSCGTQVDSRKLTAPSPSFGSNLRSKPSNEGAKIPGPGAYQAPSTIGKTSISRFKSAPATSISGREKFGSTIDLKEAARTPGPGDYTSKIINPKESRAPVHTLGKRWTQFASARSTPGPGAYSTPSSSMTESILSTNPSNGRTKIGHGNRPPLLQTSSADVGPGQYSVGSTVVGKQQTSNFKNANTFSFSVAGRKNAPIGSRMNHDNVPGPGSYKLNPSVGKQVLSIYTSAPTASMSGRVKFGSHF